MSLPTLSLARRLVKRNLPTQVFVMGLALGCEHSDLGTRGVASPSSAPSREQATVEPARPSSASSGAPRQEPPCLVAMATVSPEAAPPAETCPTPPQPPRELPTGTLRFLDAPSAPVLQVERAETDADRALGLMYRTQLDEDRGMLFSWSQERPRSFWMKNTCLPLDMLSIDGRGVIVGILEQVPTLNELPRRMPCPASRVLEVNAGFARRHGIAPGQRVSVDF